MIVPQFWAEARLQHRAHRKQVTVRRFGWSDLSQEDAHHRMATGKLGTAYTWYTEEYDKDNKDAKVSVVTRFRYLITVEARNQTADQVAMVKGVAEAIAKTFDGK